MMDMCTSKKMAIVQVILTPMQIKMFRGKLALLTTIIFMIHLVWAGMVPDTESTGGIVLAFM
jgi:hypothetical protein